MSEDVSEKEQIDALINWINTFAISQTVKGIDELFDGVLLCEVFAQIAPRHVDMSALKRSALNNWLLRKANVKLLLTNIEEFYSDELNIASDAADVDIDRMCKNESNSEMIKLIELILGAAIECENKKEYIENIMLLDESSQRILMVFIERLLREHQTKPAHSPRHHSQSYDDVSELQMHSLRLEKEELQEQYDELQVEHSSLASENANLRSEKETLMEMVKNMEKQLDEKTKKEQHDKERREKEETELINALQKHSRQISEEQYHALQIEIEEKDKSLFELKKKVDELSKYAAEARKLRDEMDMMKEKLANAAQVEEKFAHLQDKLKEMAELRKQYKALQEQSNTYMQRSIELEDEVVKIPLLKAQIEDYKKQVLAFRSEAATTGEKDIKQQLDMQQLQEALKQIQTERDMHQEKVDAMEDTIAQLKTDLEEARLMGGANRSMSSDDDGLSDFHEIFTPELREKMARLERENNRLKSEVGEGGAPEQIALLQAKLDDATALNATYEEKLRQLSTSSKEEEGVGQAQKEVVDLMQELTKKDATIVDLEEQLRKVYEEAKRYRANAAASGEAKLEGPVVEEIAMKLAQVQEKNEALNSEKLRLEGYLRTAKKMIRELRQQKKDDVDAETAKQSRQAEETMQVLRAQLLEKEREIKHLKQDTIKDSRDSTEREQRLLVSSFYDMGLQLARAQASRPDHATPSAGNNASVQHQPQSWLAALRNARAK